MTGPLMRPESEHTLTTTKEPWQWCADNLPRKTWFYNQRDRTDA